MESCIRLDSPKLHAFYSLWKICLNWYCQLAVVAAFSDVLSIFSCYTKYPETPELGEGGEGEAASLAKPTQAQTVLT